MAGLRSVRFWPLHPMEILTGTTLPFWTDVRHALGHLHNAQPRSRVARTPSRLTSCLVNEGLWVRLTRL